jgi:hypothetical protein
LSLAAFALSFPHPLPSDAADDAGSANKPAAAQAAASPPKNETRPAAPAADPATQGLRHGARSKASDGSMLVWDNVSGLFVSPEHPNTYWVAERFYRYQDGVWLTSAAMAGPWQMVGQHMVPEIARARHLGVLKESVTTRLPSGREAVYEPRLKVFKIAGKKGVFLFDAVYYRYDNGVWLESSSDEGPWTATSAKRLPGVLRRGVPLPQDGTKVTLPSGETLVSEGETGVFAVEGRPDAVYFDGSFYERRENEWLVSDKSASGFQEIATSKVPGVVRSNYHKGSGGGGKAARADKQKPAHKAKAASGDEAAPKKKAAGKDDTADDSNVAEPQ